MDAVEAYDRTAGETRAKVSGVVFLMNERQWPTPEDAHAAWMKGRSPSMIAEQVQAGTSTVARVL